MIDGGMNPGEMAIAEPAKTLLYCTFNATHHGFHPLHCTLLTNMTGPT